MGVDPDKMGVDPDLDYKNLKAKLAFLTLFMNIFNFA